MPRKTASRVRGGRLEIRPLRESELPLMVDVWRKAGLPSRPKGRDTLSNLKSQRRRDPDMFIGAFEDGMLVGVVIGSDDGRKGWINRLAVLPGSMKKGVAKALISACEDTLRRRGRLLFSVLIEDYNEASMKLFLNAGYSREDDILYFAKREDKTY